jgi:hypothetical protein
MIRLAGLSLLALFASHCCAVAQEPRESDPLFREIKRLVQDQANCFAKEARVVSRSKADLETAAYGVLARCADQMQRYKAFSARNDIRNPAQFEQYWATREATDLQHVKKLIAFFRTQPE